MSLPKSPELITRAEGRNSPASSPSGMSNDARVWSPPPATSLADNRSLSNKLGSCEPIAGRSSPFETYWDLHHDHSSFRLPPAGAAASLPPSSHTSSLHARSYTSSQDITTRSPSPLAFPSIPYTAPRSPSPGRLRVDALAPNSAPPIPLPKSPRHFSSAGRLHQDRYGPDTALMGSGQSKSAPPESTFALQQQHRQHQQRLQKSNPNGLSVPPVTTAPQATAPQQPSMFSPQSSQVFASRSQSPYPAPISTSTSYAPSAMNGLQSGTPTSAAGSFGSGASKFMRKIAGRKKKSEDATAFFARSGHLLQEGAIGSRSLSELAFGEGSVREMGRPMQSHNSVAPSQSIGVRSSASSSTSALSASSTPIVKKPIDSPRRQPSPPVNPSSVVKAPPPSVDVGYNNRTSIITLNPTITSAVDFMKSLPIEEDGDDRRAMKRPGNAPSTHVPPNSAPAASTSYQPISPTIDKEKSTEQRLGEGKTSSETKETWRKSDSTIGQRTIRQNSTTRPSRPVSMAESFQSAYTVVPGGGSGSLGGNKRWSTLTADVEFGVMVEEDGEDAEDDVRQPRQSASTPMSATLPPPNVKASTSPSSKQQKRRSRSLNVNIVGSSAPQVGSSYVNATGATNHGPRDRSMSHSISESTALPAFPTSPYMRAHSPLGPQPKIQKADLAQPFPHQQRSASPHGGQPHFGQAQNKSPLGVGPYLQRPPSQQDHYFNSNSSLHGRQGGSNNNLRGRFSAWAAGSADGGTGTAGSPSSRQSGLSAPVTMPPLSNSAHAHAPGQGPHHSHHRTTTISLSNSLAPAAGLARRAAEKLGGIGKKWGLSTSSSGSGYSSSASSRDASLWSSSPSRIDHGQPLARTNSNESSLASSMKSGNGSLNSSFNEIVHRVQLPVRDKHHKDRKRRTPNAPSGAYSLTSSVTSASTSESDAFFPSSGPVLGVLLRGPLKPGVVFGRDLRTVITQTRAMSCLSDREDVPGGVYGHLIKEVEHRQLPALVVRCAQHLLIWGVQEEGLFRVSGRSSHVSKLRSEFDTGADYDLSYCSPGDLDPHAVASVFKAYLRELPEAILTQHLHSRFEAAIAQELETYPVAPQSTTPAGSPPKSKPMTNLHKVPSLSTLAMPSFSGMPPASTVLIKNLRSLISQLPDENHDLVLTVVELIRATYDASKETKMPLSNLLLVFCPSLNMSPPLLKALCTSPGIWDPLTEDDEDVLDIKRTTIVVEDTTFGPDDEDYEDLGDDIENASSSDYHASINNSFVSEELGHRLRSGLSATRPDVPTIYLDSQSQCSSSSLSSTQDADHASLAFHSSPPPLSASADSLATPASSAHPSLSHLPMDTYVNPTLNKKSSGMDLEQISEESAPLVVRIERDIVSDIGPDGRVQFPPSPPLPNFPSTHHQPQLHKRRSMALLSMSSFPPVVSHEAHTSENSLSRAKKPSLRRLFTKRSTPSLTSLSTSAHPSPKVRAATLQSTHGFSFSPSTPRSATDSSVSTPVSAVTAPQSATSLQPPVLDTTIDSGSSLSYDLGLRSPSPPATGATDKTFLASKHGSQEASGPELSRQQLSPPNSRTRNSSTGSNHLGLLEDNAADDGWSQSVLAAAQI